MAGPLTPRPGRGSSADAQGRWWVDVAFTAGLQRRSVVWPALLGGIVLGHVGLGLAMLQNGRPWLWALVGNRAPGLLTRWGALTARSAEEPGRFVSWLFLHGDGLHLLMNGLALVGLGRLAEALYGPGRLLWLFLLCGVASGLASWAGGVDVSVGASGALFGWMGALLSFGVRYRRVLPEDLKLLFRRQLLPGVLLNLGIGMLLPFVDNHAHAGGLVAGVILGWVLGNRVVPGEESPVWARALSGLASAALLGLGLLQILSGAAR